LIIIIRFRKLLTIAAIAVCIIILLNIIFGAKPSVVTSSKALQTNLTTPITPLATTAATPPTAATQKTSESPGSPSPAPQKYIKWVDFRIPQAAMEKAINVDIKSHAPDSKVQISWIEVLSYLAAKYYGNMSSYKSKDMDQVVATLNNGETIQTLSKGYKLFDYYFEAYSSVLSGLVGEYSTEYVDKAAPNTKLWKKTYGLKAFSPFGSGYYYGHFDDFGTSRSFGYKRKHLGHDMMGSVGTPIVAIESGTVEALGWNPYGGWRIGIRTLDNKRSYYYAHLRKTHPYHANIQIGSTVRAGDVIGYLGMTGYSTKEGSNNVKKPHLHVGMQLVFNEVQKEGINQIWIDLYDIINLLQKHRSQVKLDPITKDFNRVYGFVDPQMLD